MSQWINDLSMVLYHSSIGIAAVFIAFVVSVLGFWLLEK